MFVFLHEKPYTEKINVCFPAEKPYTGKSRLVLEAVLNEHALLESER